jgi:hypothetical protein
MLFLGISMQGVVVITKMQTVNINAKNLIGIGKTQK